MFAEWAEAWSELCARVCPYRHPRCTRLTSIWRIQQHSVQRENCVRSPPHFMVINLVYRQQLANQAWCHWSSLFWGKVQGVSFREAFSLFVFRLSCFWIYMCQDFWSSRGAVRHLRSGLSAQDSLINWLWLTQAILMNHYLIDSFPFVHHLVTKFNICPFINLLSTVAHWFKDRDE